MCTALEKGADRALSFPAKSSIIETVLSAYNFLTDKELKRD